ncbi:tRNA (adenosine(37)-N6)-dimethylallyltransferase MiaA [Candidatus Wolfebacteria bacterium RBG_13_41_7]|uniref:tRNA dimethylallyltransferase n=1 Tax=Candidatus Wolfebacteria bacterium RBG_13_41_7 TaxID=1802554 RepID=A0A1F8DMN3_9BACT|nr:MAG: tRNA (adenosine(37)-N6)-dimethylallyltransferase MiaA [Candidatus Wolfebacteria bacterium RBG_13_41_7]
MSTYPKIIVVLGPTASGKSDLAVKIAKKLSARGGSEIISADSRQVYKGLDIGSGKVPRDKTNLWKSDFQNMEVGLPYIYKGIVHHLLDVASPKNTFTVSQYQKLAGKAIEEILKRGKIPIICGGTGFYIDALIYDYKLPEVPPQPKLRKELEKKSCEELFKQLKKLDLRRTKNIDKFNKRRLIRALEIVLITQKPIPALFSSASINGSKKFQYNILFIGVKKSQEKLKKIIAKRLKKRLKNGMIEEIEKLHKQGVSWKKLESLGLEYRWLARYLQNKVNYAEMISLLQKDIEHYAKRQMTWFKKNKNINWIENYEQTKKLINNFL